MGFESSRFWLLCEQEEESEPRFALSLWTAAFDRVQSQTVLPELEGENEFYVCSQGETVWVVASSGRLFRTEGTPLKTESFAVPRARLGAPALCAGALWIPTDRDGGSLLRAERATRAVAPALSIVYPRATAGAGDALWVSHATRVSRVDPRTRRTRETFELSGEVLLLAAEGPFAWVIVREEIPSGTVRSERKFLLVQLAMGREPEVLGTLPGPANALCVGAGALWIAGAELWRYVPGVGLERYADVALRSLVVVGELLLGIREDFSDESTCFVLLDSRKEGLRERPFVGRVLALAVAP